MKRLFWSISVLSLTLFLVNCADNNSKLLLEIPDADFKAYLLENFDKNNDSQISLAEAKKVKVMDCSGKNIQSLAGIEKFTNLVSLNCSSNQIDELNLRKNKKLKKLVTTDNNVPLTIYIGWSSPLRNQALKKITGGESPDTKQKVEKQMLDLSKCTYDQNTTLVAIFFED